MLQALISKSPLGEVVSDQPRRKKMHHQLSLDRAVAGTLLPLEYSDPRDEADRPGLVEVEPADAKMRHSAAILASLTPSKRSRNQ